MREPCAFADDADIDGVSRIQTSANGPSHGRSATHSAPSSQSSYLRLHISLEAIRERSEFVRFEPASPPKPPSRG